MMLQIIIAVEKHPIASGIAALLFGAFLGLAIPQGEAESEFLCGTRTRLLDRAKSAAESIQQQARDAAREIVDNVQEQRKAGQIG
jgi:hypothetical protein